MTTPIKMKATIMYPSLTKVNDRFNPDTPKYEVSLAQLSEAAKSALEAQGVKVYTKDGMGHKITCKSINPIKAFDTDGNEIDGDIIGNESEAVAMIGFWSNSYGTFPQLSRLVVTKLVEYTPNNIGAGVADDLDVL